MPARAAASATTSIAAAFSSVRNTSQPSRTAASTSRARSSRRARLVEKTRGSTPWLREPLAQAGLRAAARAVTKHATRAVRRQRLRGLGPQLAAHDPLRGDPARETRVRAGAARARTRSAAPSTHEQIRAQQAQRAEVRQRLRARAARRTSRTPSRARARAAGPRRCPPAPPRRAAPAARRSRPSSTFDSKVSPAGPSPQRRQPTVVVPASTASSR